jgi:hypothetical protein
MLLDDNEPGATLYGHCYGLKFVTRHVNRAIRRPDFLKNQVAHSVIRLDDQDEGKGLSGMATVRHQTSSEKCTVGCPTCGCFVNEAFGYHQAAWLRSIRRLDNLRYIARRLFIVSERANDYPVAERRLKKAKKRRLNIATNSRQSQTSLRDSRISLTRDTGVETPG